MTELKRGDIYYHHVEAGIFIKTGNLNECEVLGPPDHTWGRFADRRDRPYWKSIGTNCFAITSLPADVTVICNYFELKNPENVIRILSSGDVPAILFLLDTKLLSNVL